MGFYESAPVDTAPFLELPSHQLGALGHGMRGERANYSLLEPVRAFYTQIGLWRWKGLAMPSTAILLANSPAGLSAFQQVEDRFTVPPGSWIVGFSGFSQRSAGFRFQIFDVGANDYAFTEQWLQNGTDAQDNSDVDPALPYTLAQPYCVVSANKSGGMLQVKLVNSANQVNDVSLLIHLACPIPPGAVPGAGTPPGGRSGGVR